MEIVFAGAQKGRPIKCRAPAQHSAHVQALGGAVHLDLPVVIRFFVNEHRLFVVNGLWQHVLGPPLQQENGFARLGTAVREGGPSGAAADNDHVAIERHVGYSYIASM